MLMEFLRDPRMHDIALKLTLAVLLSGMIGLERERKGRAAGWRTNILVCLGATLVMIYGDVLAGADARSRIVQGVLTGVGFLGAGAIITSGTRRYGLTTAAMVWFVATIGIAIGAGEYLLGVLATAAGLLVATGLHRIERHLPAREFYLLELELPPDGPPIEEIAARLREARIGRVRMSAVYYDEKGTPLRLQFHLTTPDFRGLEHIADHIRARYPEARRLELKEWGV